MLSVSLDALLKLSKTSSPQKLFVYDCVMRNTVHWTLDKSLFTIGTRNTAMFNWSTFIYSREQVCFATVMNAVHEPEDNFFDGLDG